MNAAYSRAIQLQVDEVMEEDGRVHAIAGMNQFNKLADIAAWMESMIAAHDDNIL